MPVAADARCPACRGQHTLCLDEDFLFCSTSYEYTCPQSGTTARLVCSDLQNVVEVCPPWSIKIRALRDGANVSATGPIRNRLPTFAGPTDFRLTPDPATTA